MKTDDVLEAIERCVSDTGSCRGCPLECKSRCQQKLLDAVRDTINSQNTEIERLKAENGELKLKMSYMKEPNTIGDVHEMGAW